jgi:two-component system OmpR family response regulator
MRILVIEDEPDLLDALGRALREDGYAIDTAGDGREGLFKAGSVPYDAIVLDVMLPQLNGLDLLRKLRADGNRVPVLLLTARDALADRVAGLDAGADDYVLKPFEVEELLARLRALIRRHAGVASPRISLGNLLIDTARKTIHRNRRAVRLTAREYALAELLAMHAGKLVSRTMIYEHLFAEDDDSLSNLVEVYVHSLRRKLGRDTIETRRGQGYVMTENPADRPKEAAHD